MQLTPLYDMLLVKPDPEPDTIGSIAIPQGVLKAGHEPGDSQDCFTGVIVAAGPGDQVVELECRACGVRRSQRITARFKREISVGTCVCGESRAEIISQSRMPMDVQVGDRIAFPRRPTAPGGNCDVYLEGERYLMFHAEQFAFGVMS
jgi:co-chaperonin GroES (HSP10)